MATTEATLLDAPPASRLRYPLGVPLPILAAVVLTLAGISSIWPTALVLYTMWIDDPLKSIGMLVPVASLALILRVWRSLRWEMRGSWWGLALLLATAAAVRFREQSVLVLILSPRWSIYFPPHSLVALAYATGCVLLFGGLQLLRAARFPVLLTLLVNPVPHVFNVFVDLPLQRVSAHVARAFAHALHQKLTPDQMRLMFTPDFGMFIAPGCNGIRGAVTMGMIALVVGYLYRFRLRDHALFVVAAVLLGYIFNFVRLCTLVLFYILALKIPWLQDRAEMGDYLIGAALFLVAVGLLFSVIRHLQRAEAAPAPRLVAPAQHTTRGSLFGTPAHLAAMLVFSLFAGVHCAHAYSRAQAIAGANLVSSHSFPPAVGGYHLDRTWAEGMTGGPILFDWAAYAPPPSPVGASPSLTDSPPLPVAIGLSPTLGSHDSSICHSARGEDPVWHGQLEIPTAAGPQTFSSSFFNDGALQYLELSTVCTALGCAEYTTGDNHLGLIYTRPAPAEALAPEAHRPIPVLLRIETSDTAMPADLARAELTAAARQFLAGADLLAIIRPTR